MLLFDVITTLLIIAALFSYINERYLKLQSTIGLMLLALVFALSIEVLHVFNVDIFHNFFHRLLTQINFGVLVLQGILCFFLFAGALNVPLKTLEKEKWPIITLAVVGTLLTTFIIGTLCWIAFQILNLPISYIYALIFGAIVSPTDPIAALSILSSMGIPKKLEVLIDGESQFNDGVGVVIFVTLTGIALEGTTPSVSATALFFLREVLGGIGLGLVVAALTHHLIHGSKHMGTQLLITLAAVTFNYAIAESLQVSGPIASVIFGIIFGNYTLHIIKDTNARNNLSMFWDMINNTLVSVLFVLIGLEILIIHLPKSPAILMPLLAIAFVLIGRYISIIISGKLLNTRKRYNLVSDHKLTKLLTWTGLRGGLAIALVMSLPAGKIRDLFLLMTYAVVVFSILVQGLTIKRFFSKKDLESIIAP